MAESKRTEQAATITVTEEGEANKDQQENSSVPDGAVGGALKLKLTKKDSEKKVVKWTEETVDNEHLGKKKSKSCCIYTKPKRFIPGGSGDSDSSSDESDDDDCGHCPGHHGKDANPQNGSK